MKSHLVAMAATLAIAATSSTASAMSCSFTSTVGVAFGSYDVFDDQPLDSTGSLTFECSGVVASDRIQIEISAGGSGSFLLRKMSQGLQTIGYNLFTNASRTSVWGDGSSGSSRYGPVLPADGEPSTVPIYGRIAPRQNVRVGSYSDDVIVTVVF